MPTILEDIHVHSTFSDGKNTLEENVAAATARGLRRLVCVDHVRRDTPWVAQFVSAVAEVRKTASLEVQCGLEAKILDESGALDVPDDYAAADFVYVADHRLPIASECLSPAAVKDRLRDGHMTRERAVSALVRACVNAMSRYERVILAHPFSLLPKLGLDEGELRDTDLEELALVAARRGAQLEVSERWRCPQTRTIAAFQSRGVPIRFATDSHSADGIGVYGWVEGAARAAGLARV